MARYRLASWAGTIKQNLIDLGWHEKEFQNRSSFAYTVVTHDESRVLGCVYFYPTDKADFDVEVFLWVRKVNSLTDLDAELSQRYAVG